MNSVTEDASQWKCLECGETVDGTFGTCWNCQTAKGAPPSGSLTSSRTPDSSIENTGDEDGPWECAACGAEVSHDDDLCPSCGADIREKELWECAACGAEVSYDEEVCPNCGAEISEAAEEGEELSVATDAAREPADGRVATKEEPMNRPIISEAGGQQPQDVKPAAPAAEAQAPQRPPDSPLATQLPEWDLLPAHTLLVRRRPIRK